MRNALLIHPTGQSMEDEEPEVDLAELYQKHPAEIKAIMTSIVSYIVLSNVIGWFWDVGTQCGFWGDEGGCQGVVWVTLAYVSFVVVALSPGIWGVFSLATKGFTHVDKSKRDEVAWVAIFGLGGGAIWATMWLYCLPMTWGLLPWGPWDTNWWKLFVFLSGLIWVGVGPMLGAIVDIKKRFKGFAEIEKQADEFEVNFAEKLKLSVANPTEQQSVENQDQAQIIQPQFTSILGDMNIHEKYKK